MDTDADGQWMTYEELADARGIDRQSARRLASRLKWRRQKDNRQIVRVYVPSTRTMPQRGKRDISADIPAVTPADISILLRPLEAAVASLREQLDRERQRADQAEARADRGEVRADRAEEARAKAEGEVARLRKVADDARAEAEAARAAAEEPAERPSMIASKIDEVQFRRLQEAEQARKSLGRFARLKAAWRGE